MRSGIPVRAALLAVAAAAGWSLTYGGCSRDHRASQLSRNASGRGQNAATPTPGDCYNSFVPVVPDETLEYESTFSNSLPPYSYSVNFTDVSDAEFTEHQEVTGGTAPALYGPVLDRIWKCQSEGLACMEYPDLSRPESRLKFDTLDSVGVAIPLPERWLKGTKWTRRYTVRGRMSFVGAPTPVDVEGTITVAAEVVLQERVNVPAGVYEALKVQSTYNQGLTMKGKAPMPINISFAVQSWYARDIGLIKSASEDLRVTTVLKSLTK